MSPRPTPTARPTEGTDEVLVSAGGGAVGAPLLFAALAARPLTPLADNVWRFLDRAEPSRCRLRAARRDGRTTRTIVERFRADFSARLSNAALSISQAGYNTTMDILQSGVRAVVVPYEAKGETEQRLRAEILAAKGLLTVVPAAELSPARLAAGGGRGAGEAAGRRRRSTSPARPRPRGLFTSLPRGGCDNADDDTMSVACAVIAWSAIPWPHRDDERAGSTAESTDDLLTHPRPVGRVPHARRAGCRRSNGLSMRIRPGSTVALVGEFGLGQVRHRAGDHGDPAAHRAHHQRAKSSSTTRVPAAATSPSSRRARRSSRRSAATASA